MTLRRRWGVTCRNHAVAAVRVWMPHSENNNARKALLWALWLGWFAVIAGAVEPAPTVPIGPIVLGWAILNGILTGKMWDIELDRLDTPGGDSLVFATDDDSDDSEDADD